MFAHRTVRRAFLAAAVLSIVACGEHPTHPVSDVRADSGAHAPSIGNSIAGIAPSPSDQATLAALRAPVAWIGAVHHEAMQEVLHDPHVSEYTGRGPDSPACAAQIRYMNRYAQRIASVLDSLNVPQRDAPVDVNDLALRVGSCTIMPTRITSPSTPLAAYAMSLSASLQTASSLEEARRDIDAVLLDASRDRSLSAQDLSSIAALTVVAISSTAEWHGLSTLAAAQRPVGARQRTLQTWTASSTSDVSGCGNGTSTLGCAIGSIGGSILGW